MSDPLDHALATDPELLGTAAALITADMHSSVSPTGQAPIYLAIDALLHARLVTRTVTKALRELSAFAEADYKASMREAGIVEDAKTPADSRVKARMAFVRERIAQARK